MLAKQFGHPAQVHRLEVGVEHGGVHAGGILAQVIGNGADQLLQSADQRLRQFRQHAVLAGLVAVQLVPAALDTAERLVQ
ncbi:hypothetical protein SSTU70S_03030 [Stutzerimonas stutzeri]